uniref:C2H2-type domain-containing protein n=1 Tax=Globodera rostochiensis TaxID=31243 RepID=A0A914GSM9_GLORO
MRGQQQQIGLNSAADEQAQFPFSNSEHPSGRCEFLPPTAAAWRAAAFSVPSLHGTVSEGTAREQLLIRPTEDGAQVVIDFCACPTCPARFGTESALRAHLKTGLVICGLCGKHYCSETLFQAHWCPLKYSSCNADHKLTAKERRAVHFLLNKAVPVAVRADLFEMEENPKNCIHKKDDGDQQQQQQQKVNESILRVSFLEQASTLLANNNQSLVSSPTRPSSTSGSTSGQSTSSDSTSNLLSRLLLRELRECAFVDQLRMHRDFKRSHCKRCFQNWLSSNVAGGACQIEIKPRPGAIVRVCKNCGAKRRFTTANPSYRSRNEKEGNFA